ncbi:MAG TPA: DUF3861 domain-containing protein [Thiobacillaceae bacterium]|nr:DUF3861 domain-containing protein [Thiobacillaceae bacterium]HNU64595.1 DUF3861 domain-containing protein [Thiobacillaceae bacterium]
MKSHKYHISVTRVEDKDGHATDGPSITFASFNHDEIIEIVRRIQGAGVFPADEAASFAVGLKLFGEAMLTHKDSELFTELRPHFMAFMKKLKASLKDG